MHCMSACEASPQKGPLFISGQVPSTYGRPAVPTQKAAPHLQPAVGALPPHPVFSLSLPSTKNLALHEVPELAVLDPSARNNQRFPPHLSLPSLLPSSSLPSAPDSQHRIFSRCARATNPAGRPNDRPLPILCCLRFPPSSRLRRRARRHNQRTTTNTLCA